MCSSLNEVNTQKKCNECGSEIITRGYQTICGGCGLIIDEMFIDSSFTIFNNNEFQFNQGRQYVYMGKIPDAVGNLGSYIDYYDRKKFFLDFNKRPISLKDQSLFSRLKNKYSKFSKIKNQETNYRIMNILADVTRTMKLSKDIKKDAAYYFRKIKSINDKIKNNISLIAFCIFFAVRNKTHNAPVNIREISKVFQDLGHRVRPRLIIRDGVLYKKMLVSPKPHRSEDYVERLINDIINYPILKIRMERKHSLWSLEEYRIKLYNHTSLILSKIGIFKRGGKNPFIFAGAAIYAADKLLAKKNDTKSILTQKIASRAMKIAEYSIRDHYVSVFKELIIQNFPC